MCSGAPEPTPKTGPCKKAQNASLSGILRNTGVRFQRLKK
ncbi:hypothetical protein [Polaromonas sp. CG9_12]|nr:hypothetical protein [Polaromonas sp. CG9_12]